MTIQDQDKFIVRLPDGMRDEISAAAKLNRRSMNAEIVHRLISFIGDDDLRSRYAGQALQGLLASPLDPPAATVEEHAAHYAKVSYIYADAMLVARKGGAS